MLGGGGGGGVEEGEAGLEAEASGAADSMPLLKRCRTLVPQLLQNLARDLILVPHSWQYID